VIMHTNDVI